MITSFENQSQKEGKFEHNAGLTQIEESTFKRQIAYNQAIPRIRNDLKKRARPLPVLFDDEGKWAF